MRMQVVTLFPEMVSAVTRFGVVGRAVDRGILALDCLNPRDFTTDVHRTVDDRPYGGGPGMVMKYEPLAAAIEAARQAMPAPSNASCRTVSPLEAAIAGSTASPSPPGWGRGQMLSVAGAVKPSRRCAPSCC